MPKLSYSALQTFLTCPLQYKFAYQDKLPQEQNATMHFGTLLHQVMEELHAATLLPISKEELAQIVSTKWQRRLYSDDVTAQNDFTAALEIIDREWEKNQKPKTGHTIGLERRFAFPLRDDFEITGRIDRIDKIGEQDLEIIDYKTGRSVPAESDLPNNLQLAIYYLAIKTLWPNTKAVKLTLNYLRPDMQVSFQPDAEFQAKAEQKLHDVVSQIQTSDFSAQPGSYCDRCSFKAHCPMMKHKFASVVTKKSGQELADAYIDAVEQKKEIEQKVQIAKTQLDEFLVKNNFEQVFATKGRVRRITTKMARLDSKKTKNYLKEQGVLADFLQTVEMSRIIIAQSLPPVEEL